LQARGLRIGQRLSEVKQIPTTLTGMTIDWKKLIISRRKAFAHI
jgi:hypothetical protein